MTNATVDNNVAEGGLGQAEGYPYPGGGNGSGYGGGLYVNGCTATLTNATVTGNSAVGFFPKGVGYGGGLYIVGSGVSLDPATVAQVTGNTASSGAAYDNIDGPYKLR